MSDVSPLVSFLPTNKIILVNDNITLLNVERDIYFAWKSWVSLDNNAAYLPALTWSWGLPDSYGTMTPIFYLINGWKIRTWEGNHTLNIDGSLYTDNGESAFAPTISYHQIVIKFTNSIVEANMATASSTLNNYLTLMSAVSAKVDLMLDKEDDSLMKLNHIIETQKANTITLAKLEDLVYQILGLSKSNFQIVSPVYLDNGVTKSTIQTFKSRDDMLAGKVFKSYAMKTDYDEQGRLQQFRIMEKAKSVTGGTPPTAPNMDMSNL